MTTEENFLTIVEECYIKVLMLFKEKNKGYGQDQDLFYNFRSTARRVLGKSSDAEYENMYRVLLTYQDKHRIALVKLGLNDPEFEERCLDELLYTLLALALHQEYVHTLTDGRNEELCKNE